MALKQFFLFRCLCCHSCIATMMGTLFVFNTPNEHEQHKVLGLFADLVFNKVKHFLSIIDTAIVN